MSRPTLNDVLPPELIGTVAKIVDIEEYLSMKLTCKAINACMPRLLPELVRDECRLGPKHPKYRCIDLHKHLEHLLTRDRSWRSLDSIICADCGMVRRKTQFQDSQR